MSRHKYIPDLIPQPAKVLPDYFNTKKNDPNKKPKKTGKEIIDTIIFIVLLIFAAVYIPHPVISLVLGFAALVTLPSGRSWLEHKLRFSLTKRIRLGSYILAGITLIPLLVHYHHADILAEKQRIADLAREKRQQEIKKEENRKRLDSLNLYLSRYSAQKHNPEKADAALVTAATFLTTIADTVALGKATNDRDSVRGEDLLKWKKYQSALNHFDKMLGDHGEDPKLLYDRAYCYYKLGKIKLAVADLGRSRDLNYSGAKTLYNKINPLKRRISGYITLCCDGTTSGASGRGACSWHGGVCNWNSPIYEEYRKY
ncbi:tol-pal system YbgF family protein [Pedobacter kyonggii]|uniref:Tetratricopeptide repeat protein n=1 Tax=Pedobacter kyonggii TaxID=1926871 RepID=A0A4Q9HHT8_9SPHI|nr:tetratricopeptide repeat protein [Pedobacter kyonggii]TBO44260.1 hypothetical protein EYS08_02825 [Pedobacter kyonggii]